MRQIKKKLLLFNLIACILISGSAGLKATEVKNCNSIINQDPRTWFMAKVLDEHGKEMVGAVGRIKGREDEKLRYGQTSGKNQNISFLNYPENSIIVISKPGYVTQEISTVGLKQPKKWSHKEFLRCITTVKMVPVKKNGKQAAKKK